MADTADMPSTPEFDQWFRTEVEVHREALLSWLRERFPSIGDPENLVQESLARVCRYRQGGHEVPSVRGLLYRTARNLAVDQIRRQKVFFAEPMPETGSPPVYEESLSPDEEVAHHQELELLTQAIQTLPERCRRVLTLRKIYRMSQKEIAAELGISEHTVERQVMIGMRKCIEFFSRYGLP